MIKKHVYKHRTFHSFWVNIVIIIYLFHPEKSSSMIVPDTVNPNEVLEEVLNIYDQKQVAEFLNQYLRSVSGKVRDRDQGMWSRESINRLRNRKSAHNLIPSEVAFLRKEILPAKDTRKKDFTFIDLFAGIGGIRKGFEAVGGECLFTSEWNKFAQRTYKANFYNGPNHSFNSDIREVTLSEDENVSDDEAYEHIRKHIPEHDVLLAGFPCQPFSIAGVSKKNALGRKHGFECSTQGTLFFDVARIIQARKPLAFVLENVKNLRSHDKGKTFKVIKETLDELGYWVADSDASGAGDPKVIDGQNFVPQHRERIILVGFRKDLNVHGGFTLKNITKYFSVRKPSLGEILEPEHQVDDKYILTPKLWEYLYNYALKHKAKGNGFGYGLVNKTSIARTLSARYYKDGAEILVDRGENERPRRLTPRECSRLMGFDQPGEQKFKIPVSDTQAYKQFGNSVIVPMFESVAKLMKSAILQAKKID